MINNNLLLGKSEHVLTLKGRTRWISQAWVLPQQAILRIEGLASAKNKLDLEEYEA